MISSDHTADRSSESYVVSIWQFDSLAKEYVYINSFKCVFSELPKDCGDEVTFESSEEEEVSKFVQEMVKNWGIIDVMCRFLLRLCFKDHLKWYSISDITFP